jgi:hypothetical protein
MALCALTLPPGIPAYPETQAYVSRSLAERRGRQVPMTR